MEDITRNVMVFGRRKVEYGEKPGMVESGRLGRKTDSPRPSPDQSNSTELAEVALSDAVSGSVNLYPSRPCITVLTRAFKALNRLHHIKSGECGSDSGSCYGAWFLNE